MDPFKIANCDHEAWSKCKVPTYAFTEHGAIMAANVLNSHLAIQMSVFVVRAFIKIREMVIAHRELSKRIDELEKRLNVHSVLNTQYFFSFASFAPWRERIG